MFACWLSQEFQRLIFNNKLTYMVQQTLCYLSMTEKWTFKWLILLWLLREVVECGMFWFCSTVITWLEIDVKQLGSLGADRSTITDKQDRTLSWSMTTSHIHHTGKNHRLKYRDIWRGRLETTSSSKKARAWGVFMVRSIVHHANQRGLLATANPWPADPNCRSKVKKNNNNNLYRWQVTGQSYKNPELLLSCQASRYGYSYVSWRCTTGTLATPLSLFLFSYSLLTFTQKSTVVFWRGLRTILVYKHGSCESSQSLPQRLR